MPGKRGRCEFSNNGAVATDGNTLRLAMAAFLCSVPAFLPTLATLCSKWSGDTQSRTDGIIREPVDSPGYALVVLIEVTLLALAYRFLAAPGGARQPTAA